jgi:hypothetical protein
VARTQLPADVHELFHVLDADENGYLDYQEIVSGVSRFYATGARWGTGWHEPLLLSFWRAGAAMLGCPFASDEEAREAFSKMNTHCGRVSGSTGPEMGDGRVTEAEFVAWWMSAEHDQLQTKLAEKFGFSAKAVRHARGVMFGWWAAARHVGEI